MFNKLAFLLTIIGGLNWGLIGFFGLDLVAVIFGGMTLGARIVYAVIGISAVITLGKAKTMCSR